DKKLEDERIDNELKKKKYVLSMPRNVIIKYLFTIRTHHTAESIYKALSKEYSSISISTVYNTLKVLVKEGFITQLTFEGERIFYDSTPGEHAHFICRVCGKIKDVWNSKIKIDLKNYGKVESVHVYYYGICKECL
ncbi:MAG: Fur family transcriptional regulator, partial [Candidatus Aminicenantia bacterium]